MKDAQQDVIEELRRELERSNKAGAAMKRHMNLCRDITKCPDDETLAVWLEKGLSSRIRLDDPVVKRMAMQLEELAKNHGPGVQDSINKALAAYNARLKEVGCE